MTQPSPELDPFPASDFDRWAAQYDQDVKTDAFPFTGYRRVLAEVVRQAGAQPGMSVLDLGTGTGNLAAIFATLGCEVWGTDFSGEMLAIARVKLPEARFFQHDLRQPFPAELRRRFDRIVSGYVFHHFELPEKVAVVEQLVLEMLAPGGRVVIADIAFPSLQAQDLVRQASGELWDEELYWIAAEALPALEAAGMAVEYVQVSDCAGVYRISRPG